MSTSDIETISPIDGSVYVRRNFNTQEQVADYCTAAKQAQKHWQNTALSERQAICQNAVKTLLEQQAEIGLELSWMMGRPIAYAQGELNGLAERAEHMISIAEQQLAPLQIPEKPGFSRYIQQVALGTVLIVAPWNYPYLTAINSLVPALLAGNCVLLKHSAQTPLCAERLYAAFKQAGLPQGVLQYLHLSHQQTAELIASDSINGVVFTGSVAGGKAIEAAALGRFIPVGLELGGKDPAYVRADANLEQAVETLMDGAFFNSGQSCCGIERIYVAQSCYQAFLDKSIAWVNQLKLGRSDDPNTSLGPVVNSAAAEFVRQQTKDAIAQGAVAHIDEAQFPLSQEGTPYLAPQILTGVNHQMSVMSQESFGPVVGIMPVADDQEAIQLMNDSEFGLTATIFTQDIQQGTQLGQQLETGTFFINRCDYLDPALAWTGVKNSGRGCALSALGFQGLTRPKSFHIKHLD